MHSICTDFVEGAWVCQKEEFSPKPLHFPVHLTQKQFKPCLFKGASPGTDSLWNNTNT